MLSEAVRDAIRTIGQGKKFRTSQVFEILQQKYPDYVTEDKKGSVSATMSNLVNNHEITREIDGQRKVWYLISNLKGVGSEVLSE